MRCGGMGVRVGGVVGGGGGVCWVYVGCVWCVVCGGCVVCVCVWGGGVEGDWGYK